MNRPCTQQVSWRSVVSCYETPSTWRSIWQLLSSVVPYVILWYCMYYSLNLSYWLTLPLIILAAGFYVRIFIIFHDCGHRSFFKSRRVNTLIGRMTGLMTFAAYENWRHDHAIHHATSGHLNKRGIGDVWTLTVHEYLHLSPLRQRRYRFFRHPWVVLGLGGVYILNIRQRFWSRYTSRRQRWSIVWTNVAILCMVVIAMQLMGPKAYVVIQVSVSFVAGVAGTWLFYVQHQYEGAYWRRTPEWDFVQAALRGSSYFKLPKVLQWFTGNIGFHHVHHLAPQIPNYYLERSSRNNPEVFGHVQPLTLRESLRAFTLALWDEENQALVSFQSVKRRDHT